MQLNVDIIYLICEELDPAQFERYSTFYDARTARKTLLSLGLTNKTFLEPALDVLWKKIYSVDVLLYFLQTRKDLGTRSRVITHDFSRKCPSMQVLDSMRSFLRIPRGGNQKVIMKCQIDPSRWNRMLYYTSRVRVISLYRLDCVGGSIYPSSGEAPQCIFPNLRKLCASQLLISSGSLPFFLSDSLLSVEFSSYGKDAPDLGPTLSSVAQMAPTLEEITLLYGEHRPFSSFSSTLRTLEELRVLRIHGIPTHYDQDFIATISNLRKLTDLSLKVPSTTRLNYNGIPNSGFASLKHFSIGASIDETHAFLSKVPSTVLQSLEVTT
ncbi:hypothetical protein BT96DRAFT_993123 [Gymnopus androsaceus JB14]|uniref:F-box domain-containing protein n=1 Tax=Gymnopus androsaceus JB14 TaxID=1447944 RepID=A0A6A4HQB6_9AGAR|nr:hypothetical protein BT96DRAFT_993123 [Gymnopus androsaceus JB14]